MPRNRFSDACLVPALLAVVALSLAACKNPGTTHMSEPEIQIKERPNPQKAHRIEMIIENAPGPFAVIEGAANYSVKNHFECGHIDPVPGIASRITTHPPIVWTPVGEGRYEATVYEDLIVDEDYYGRGVCRWELTEVSAMLKATGAKAETRFLPGIPLEKIEAGETLKLFFLNRDYPVVEKIDDYAEFGEQDVEQYKPELRDQTFSVVMRRAEGEL